MAVYDKDGREIKAGDIVHVLLRHRPHRIAAIDSTYSPPRLLVTQWFRAGPVTCSELPEFVVKLEDSDAMAAILKGEVQ